MDPIRSKNIAFIKRKIKELNLDLTGETVLTELGNNHYQYTPLIAALAGADHVIAWTGTNQHFDAIENADELNQFAKELQLSDRIEVRIDEKSMEDVKKASIITNSGFLRSIDQKFLENCAENTVIPLMYEAWEVRDSDININVAKELAIKVAGTFENHKSLRVFDGVGPLAVKLALEAGHEVFNNNIVVYSDDHFGEVTAKAFENFGARKVTLTRDKSLAMSLFPETDFIYLCAYNELETYFEKDFFPLDEVVKQNPNLGVVHLYGAIDQARLKENGIMLYPAKDGKSMFMSETLAYLGPQLLFSLTIGGLKVAELVRKGVDSDLVQPITF